VYGVMSKEIEIKGENYCDRRAKYEKLDCGGLKFGMA
jgi:hypothetical protein